MVHQTSGDDLGIVQAIIESLAVGVVVCDQSGKLLSFSPEAERILGTGWSNTDPPGQLPLARALRGEEVPHELIFIRNSGQPDGVWISVSGRPFRDAGGSIAGAVVVLRDVSEVQNLWRGGSVEKPAELPDGPQHGAFLESLDQFRAFHERFRQALEQTGDSVIMTDRHGVIEYVNRAFEETTGYASHEVLGRTPKMLKSGQHDAEFYRNLWSRLLAGESFRGTIINRRKCGALYWSEQTISPVKNGRGEITHFVSVLKDITDLRKRQEQEFYLDLAREIQQRFYQPAISVPGFDIAGMARPADQTGGDYFDFIAQPDGRFCLVIGDVSGHGFGSALVMAGTRAYLRSYARLAPDMGALLGLVNRALAADLDGGQHVTLLAACVAPRDRRMQYAGAGHVHCYLLRAGGQIGHVMESDGPPLGIFPEHEYSVSGTIPLDAGDTLVLLTDGVCDWANAEGADFGAQGALEFIRSHIEDNASDLAHGLYKAARSAAGGAPQPDDFSAVICKVTA